MFKLHFTQHSNVHLALQPPVITKDMDLNCLIYLKSLSYLYTFNLEMYFLSHTYTLPLWMLPYEWVYPETIIHA